MSIHCSIQSAISNTGIENILVPFPDYNDQIQIAGLLSKAENLIANAKKASPYWMNF